MLHFRLVIGGDSLLFELIKFERGRHATAVSDEQLHDVATFGRVVRQDVLFRESPPALGSEQQIEGNARLRVIG